MPPTVQLQPDLGRRPHQPVAEAYCAGPHPISRFLHVTDPFTRHRFLIDMGAEVSVLPATSADRRHPSQLEHTLRAVNGSSIAAFGTESLTVSLGLPRRFQFVFVIADIEQPIIGADFLYHHRLTVDLRARWIMDSVTELSSPATIAHVSTYVSFYQSNHCSRLCQEHSLFFSRPHPTLFCHPACQAHRRASPCLPSTPSSITFRQEVLAYTPVLVIWRLTALPLPKRNLNT